MSTTPRINSAIAGRPADFGTILAHTPRLAKRFADLYAELWQEGVVDASIKEMTRIRNARVTDCGY